MTQASTWALPLKIRPIKGASFGFSSAVFIHRTSPCLPEGVKELKTGRDREGEAPAEPQWGKDLLGRRLARRLALPIFSHLPFEGAIIHSHDVAPLRGMGKLP